MALEMEGRSFFSSSKYWFKKTSRRKLNIVRKEKAMDRSDGKIPTAKATHPNSLQWPLKKRTHTRLTLGWRERR
jgi:hypothetical protein